MAEWAARKVKKSCKQCEQLADPDSFAKGSAVRIAGIYDCENCEVMKHQPIPDNENIVTLYNALPQNYDGYSGLRLISAADIKFLLELFEVKRELWADYYQRLLYFHSQYTDQILKGQKAKREAEAWKAKRFQRAKSRRIH